MPNRFIEDDHWPLIESMVEADIGSKTELGLRYSVVFFGALFMTIHTASPVIAIWLAAFLVFNGVYSWRLTHIRAPVSRRTYLFLNAMLITSVMLYTSCAVYLFSLDTTAFKTIAVAALVAQSMFNLSRHRRGSIAAVFDTLVVTAAGLFFGLSNLMQDGQSTSEFMIILVCTLGVCSYYVIAQYRNIQTHQSLQQARIEAIQTQKMKAVGQITAGVSHDFNNLLTVIKGNIELAELSDDKDLLSETLNDAKQAADKAAKLTGQLLSFSRKARLTAAPVDLDLFWSDLNRIVRRSVPATIKVSVDVAGDLPRVYCDPNQLQNAVLNLVINARDAIQGSGQISLSSRQATDEEVKNQQRALLSYQVFGAIEITDTGVGIPNDQLPAVTEPFYTTKPVGEGSGLGLSMVKGFVEQSGGRLLISSDAVGTKVVLLLPTKPSLSV